jgi:phospholipid/cholesterol/gamma-HCH transport system ATP-binding protein
MIEGIVMEGLTYRTGGRTILSDLDLVMEPGVNRTILGVSGSGKTTILRLILGLLLPDAGRIRIDGADIAQLRDRQLNQIRRKLAIVFQGGALFDSLTVGENVGYRLLEEGVAEKIVEQRVCEMLSFVGLEGVIDRYPAELSGGMRKRVGIARALAADPDYIFFDEPTTGLDPIGVYNIVHLIRELQRRGKTTLLVTHDLTTAYAASDRFSVLHDSRFIFEGSWRDLQESPLPEIREFLSPSDRSLFVHDPSCRKGGDNEAQ